MSENQVVRQGQDASFVRRAFGAIAPRYVLTNHVLSFGVDVIWRWITAHEVARRAPQRVLDLATGSGDLAEEIQRRCPQATVIGMDFSLPMLQQAQLRGLQNLFVADAMQLPLVDSCMDVGTVAFGLRNMASWQGAVKEMARVIRCGGALMVLDFSLPRNRLVRWVYLIYLRKFMPRVAGILTGQRAAYEYLCSSIEGFPSGLDICQLLENGGFSRARARSLSFGVATLYIAEK